MNRREFLKAGVIGAAACVIPLNIPRDAIAKALFGTPQKPNLGNLCDVAMKLLNNQLRSKVVIRKGDASKGRGWKQKHVSFAYNEDTTKLPLSEVIDLHIKPSMQLLADAILRDAKRKRIVVGKLENPKGIKGIVGPPCLL